MSLGQRELSLQSTGEEPYEGKTEGHELLRTTTGYIRSLADAAMRFFHQRTRVGSTNEQNAKLTHLKSNKIAS